MTRRENTLTFVLVAALTAPALVWILLDRSVWTWDPSWYGEVTIFLWLKFSRGTWTEWYQAMLSAFGFKAPAIAWLGQFMVPIGSIFGSYEWGLLLLPYLASFCSLVYLIRTLRTLWPQACLPILSGILLVAGAPLFVGLSHLYYVEMLQLFAVTLLLFFLVTRESGIELVVTSGLAIVFGLAVKSTLPIYVVVPGLLVLLKAIRTARTSPTNRIGLIAYTFVFIALCSFSAGWYLRNWDTLRSFVLSTSVGENAQLYGRTLPIIDKIRYWTDQLDITLSLWSFMSFGLLCLLLAGLVRIRRSSNEPRHLLLVWGSLVQIVLVVLILSFQVNEETRYLLPIFPFIAILITGALVTCSRKFNLAIFLLLAVHFSWTQYLSFGGNFGAEWRRSPWLIPLKLDPEDKIIITEMVELTCPLQELVRHNIVGQEFPMFNANSAAFYMMMRTVDQGWNHGCTYASLGYAERDVELAWQRLKDQNPGAVAFRLHRETRSNDPFNAVSGEIRSRLRLDPNFHSRTDSSIDLELFLAR